MIGELLHMIRSLEKRAASAAVPDSIAHRLANPVASSPIQSIQRGTIVLGTTNPTDATITSVNTGKAHVLHLGQSSDIGAASDLKYIFARISLVSATVVRASRFGALDPGSATVGYEVVEFK